MLHLTLEQKYMNIQTRRFSEPEVFLDFSSGQRPGDYVTCHTNHGLIVEGHIDRTRSDLDLYAQGRPANRIWTTRCSPDSNLAFQIEIDLASLQFTAYRRVPNPNNDFDNPPWVTIGAEGIPDHVMNPRQREYVDIS